MAQGWIPEALAASAIRYRLSRPVKKTRDDSNRGFTAAAFFNNEGDQDQEMGENFHENAYDSDNNEDTSDDEGEGTNEQTPFNQSQ